MFLASDLIVNQVAMSEEERDRIMEEHEKNLAEMESRSVWSSDPPGGKTVRIKKRLGRVAALLRSRSICKQNSRSNNNPNSKNNSTAT